MGDRRSTRDEYYVESGRRGGGSYYAENTVVRTEEPFLSSSRMGCCTVLAVVLFSILLIIVLIALLIFFTIGRNEISNNNKSLFLTQANSQQLTAPVAAIEGAGKLVSAEYVDTALSRGNSKICLFDTSYFSTNYRQQYELEHIQGAQHFLINSVTQRTDFEERSLTHPLLFQTYVRELGVEKDCHVVLYDHGESETSIKAATFVWWMFKVYGLDNVSVMNGGLKAWKSESRATPVVAGPSVAPGGVVADFVASWRPEYLITYDDVVNNFENNQYRLLDARIPTDFGGTTKASKASKYGRIDGAVNLPIASVLTDEGAFKSASDLSAVFNNQGITPAKPLIVYCNTGMQASVVYFAAYSLNMPGLIYGGGWVEWSQRAPAELIVQGTGPVASK